MHILLTANSAWNIWNFRRGLLQALVSDDHHVTILAPTDDSVNNIKDIGCRFIPLDMNAKGLNPISFLKLFQSFKQHFRRERPDVVLSFTIKNNIFGALVARSMQIAFVPNVTGLGTAFLSTRLLQIISEFLYRKAFVSLPIVFFQNADDRDLFLTRGLVRTEQAQLLPGSGIDLGHFEVTEYPVGTGATVFLLIGRLLRDKGVCEYVEAARLVKSN